MKSRPAFAAILALAFAGLAHAQESHRPNILWIVAEDISPLFGCYGDADATTPHIDAFAENAHLFKRAYATAPICAPSRSCLATGMYATSLGTQHLRSHVNIPKKIRPLAGLLRDHGYWTALRGKTDYNFSPDGLFDYWKEDTAPWRACPPDKPFFAFLNLGSTHEGSGNLSARAAPALKRLPSELKHDPATVTLPPYFADTPEMRRIWARYHDLLTVFDLDVDTVLQQLAADGRAKDTIVFLMADHGMGIPRYKRWLYLTGLHVPLIIHVPEKFRDLIQERRPSSVRHELVSYVDLPPTVLRMAGIPIPAHFQGQALFGDRPRAYVFGARDRADDMYELSRAIFDGRYLYIRHYLPHLPPMQEGVIMSPYRKESHQELYRVRAAGGDTEHSRKLWQAKPFEELYDIRQDPQELNNLAQQERLRGIKTALATRLWAWIIETRDSGFMPEPEMHRRAGLANVTPYEILQYPRAYPIEEILKAAEQASRPGSEALAAGKDPIVTFWAIQQRIMGEDASEPSLRFLTQQLEATNPTIRVTAAEALGRMGRPSLAIPVFRELLEAEEPNLLLYIARSLAVSLTDVRPLEEDIRQTRQRMLAPPGSRRPWKDFTYSAFTTWALEWALIKSGINTPDDFDLR